MIAQFIAWLRHRSRAEARQRIIMRRNYKANIKIKTQGA